MKCSAFCLSALLLLAGPSRADSPCDPALGDPPASPLAYHQRGERCEGLYAQQVGAVQLEVRSLFASFAPFDPQKEPALVLAWNAPPGQGGQVHLRAFAFRPRTYFRMDAAVPAAGGSYRWPSDVVASLELTGQELGVVAWMTLPGRAGTSRVVYLPLRAGTGAAQSPAADEYTIAVVPSKTLRALRVTVSRLDSSGSTVAVLRQDEELGYGDYPSYIPTFFSLGRLGPAGFYRIAISAVVPSGSQSEEIEIYHPGT